MRFETLNLTACPPLLAPWKAIRLDPAFSGQWMVAGDLDGDGQLDFVTARNARQAITAASAVKLDGRVLWRFGRPGTGRPDLGYDLPLQVHDLTGDGTLEVVLSTATHLVVLEGATGVEITRHPLPTGLAAADCITFANFTGQGRPADLLLKTRYTKLWAYTGAATPSWTRLWEWPPGGQHLGLLKTCHHPEPFDLDGDGRDEVMGSNVMLDHDGTELWHIASPNMSARGHLDCLRVVRPPRAGRPETARLAVTYCGGNAIGLVDGTGRVLWEHTGEHFESIDVGPIPPDGAPGLFVDLDHRALGDGRVHLYALDGECLGVYHVDYGRHHRVLDWTGDGLAEIVLAHAGVIVDARGNLLASLDLGPDADAIRARQRAGDIQPYVSVLDITGSGRGDVVLHARDWILVYRNAHTGEGTSTDTGFETPCRDATNFTFY